MKSILDYIDNYGYLSFEEKEFGEVDSLILSQFSYLKLDGIVPCVGTMEDAVLIRDIAESDELSGLFSDERYASVNMKLFEKMSASRRFGNIGLNHYINLVNCKWEMQFSAVTFYFPNGRAHVVYRGTDETIIGWKEDFNMAYTTPVPAQVKAVDYLNYVSQRIKGDFSIGGHSKGGNLAVYAGMKCSDELRARIIGIDSHDGPGFTKETFEDGDFDKIKSRIHKFVPHSSIIGMLLQSQEQYRVILAKYVGILQHDPFNWIVEGDDFVYCDDIADHSAIRDASINEWALRADNEELKIFVNKLFDVFMRSGINDLNDIKGNFRNIISGFVETSKELTDDEKIRMKNLLGILAESFKDQLVSQIKDQFTSL